MRRWLAVLAVAFAFFLVIGKGASTVYAEWQWHAAMGALPVYRSALAHALAWRGGAAGAAFGFVLVNLYALRRSIVSLVLPRRLGNLEIGEAVPARMLLAYVVGVSAVVGVMLSAPTGDWTTFALARIAGPFREFDPFLDRDLSFAIARLPFELDLYAWAGRVMIVTAVMIVGLYALTPSLRLRRGAFYISVYCRRHLAALSAIALLLIAWRWRLDGLAVTSIGPDDGGPYNAYWHRVGGPLLAWLAALTAVAAFTVLWAGWNGFGRAAGLTALVAAIGGPMAAALLPRLTGHTLAASDVSEEDRPYANTRRLFTRRAFGVDAIDSVPSGFALARNAADALDGIPAWDPAALARAIPGRSNETDSVVMAWQPSRFGIQAMLVTRRPGSPTDWMLSALDATTADDRGRAFPAIPADGAMPVSAGWSRLLVYPGASSPAVIADTGGHVPAPSFATWWDRVALAWSVRTPRLLAADPGEVRPRLAFHRDVRDRLHEIVPFLTAGPTITPLIRADSLFWVAELFTTSDTYPLSDRLFFSGEMHAYVHHAATAYVQAMTGAVTLVATSQPDAIMRTWMRRFPTLFLSEDELPSAVASVHAPPVDWAMLQATALARTGTGRAAGAPRAAVGTDNADADLVAGPPTLFAFRSPDILAWSAPVVDASGLVTGSVVATGGAHPRTLWSPATREERWADVLDRLQQAADSAGAGRRHPSPRRGRVVTIPLADGPVYTQSHYEWGVDGGATLVGVAAFVNGTVRAGATLAEALAVTTTRATRAPDRFRTAVDGLYRRMGDALRRGDWPAFGSAFSALGRLVHEKRNP